MRYVIELELPDNDFVLSQIKYTGVSWGVWGYSGCAKAKPKTADHWIPVEEQMPEEMDEVLLRFEESRAVGFYSDGSWCVITGNGFYTELAEDEDHPNAWMPLPELLNSEGTTRKEQEHNG